MTERLPRPDTILFPPLSAQHVRTLASGWLLGRLHSQGGRYASRWDEFRRWGPTGSRFDHQPPPPGEHPTRAVLYAVPELPGPAAPPILRTCVSEVFQDRRIVELRRDDPYFVLFELTRPVRLLDLADSDWAARAGGNAALSSGPRGASRAWARAVYLHYTSDALDGLCYGTSTMPSARIVVLWERTQDALPARPLVHLPLSHPALRAELEGYATALHLDLGN